MSTGVPHSLAAWAARHAISDAALRDLLAVMLPPVAAGARAERGSEAYVQSAVRLEAPRHGVWLTRNNVGALKDISGRVVRFGLANENKGQNDAIKSADLIGIRPVVVGPEHLGATIGQFVSRECKHANWKPGEDPVREAAQLAWAKLVTRYGGDAKIVRGEGSFT